MNDKLGPRMTQWRPYLAEFDQWLADWRDPDRKRMTLPVEPPRTRERRGPPSELRNLMRLLS